jgi:hypothetical protein
MDSLLPDYSDVYIEDIERFKEIVGKLNGFCVDVKGE